MAYIKDVQVGSDTYLIEPTLYIAPTKNGAAYTATLANFSLATGATVQAKFAATNNENATLNVNSTGAKEIHYNGDKITANQFKVNHVYTLVYDGTQWQVVGDIDTNTNTWRGIQDNLTSDSTTESLSAKQGKVLKGLIDGMDATTPAASGNATAFIDSITQTDGKITSITKKNIPTVSSSTAGLAPKGTAVSTQSTSTKFLREDGTWAAPSYITNTDAKVAQSSNTEDKEFPIILKNTDNTTNETNGVKYDGDVTVNPSKSKITATTIQANSRLVASKAISQIITGTGTAGSYTNSTYHPAKWTFNTGLTATDGDIFTIKIPVAGHDYGVFMSVDNGSHYYPVVLNGTGRITTHYPVNTYLTVIFEPTGSAASMYAVAGQTSSTRITVTGGVWRVLNYYDSNSNDTGYYHRRIYPNLKAGTGSVDKYTIIMQLPNGRWSSIVQAPSWTTNSSGSVIPKDTGKSASANGFMLGHVLLMYANATYADGTNIGTYNIWSAHTGLIDARYSFNLANSTGNGFVAYTPVYIVGTVSDGLFHLDTTKWWTQTLPSSDDGKVYIYIGDAYDWYRLTFTEDKPIYWYKNGAIRLYSGASEYALSAPLSGISGADDLKAIEAISGTSGLLKKTAANTWTLDTNSYVTSSGVTKVSTGAGLTGGDITTTGTVKANLINETKLTNAAADGTETSGRVYPVRLDKNGKLAVNVPWTNVNSGYLPLTGGTMTGAINLVGNQGSAYNDKGLIFTKGSRIGENTTGGLGIYAAERIYLRPNSPTSGSGDGIEISGDGVIPSNNNTESFGDSSHKWANVYATNLNGNLSVTAHTNTTNGSKNYYPWFSTATSGNLGARAHAGVYIHEKVTSEAISSLDFCMGSSTITGSITLWDGTNHWGNIRPTNLSANRNYTLPNQDGTFALLTQTDANALINLLSTGASDLTANDYVITQYVGGGTTTTTYHRRPASKVVNATLVKAALGTDTSTTTQWLNKKGEWSTPTAAQVGAITKLSSSTDNAIVRFNGTSGQIQNSGIIIDDNNRIIIGATHAIYQNQANTSNYTAPIGWRKGNTGWYKDDNTTLYAYQPQIGQYNIGGDGTGSITILPYPTDTSPWIGSVGLFIRKGQISLDNNRIPHTGNTTGSVGGTTTPVYVEAGVIKAGTALGTASQKAESYFVKAITSTDNAITRFDGTSGQIQDSKAILDDNGNLLIANDASIKIYHQTNTTYGYETYAIQTCFDGTDPETSTYTSTYESRCNLLLQPRGGQVYIGTDLTTTGDTNYSLYVTGNTYLKNTLVVKDIIPDATDTYSLGTTSKRWNAYFAPKTIGGRNYIYSTPITGGRSTIEGKTVVFNPNANNGDSYFYVKAARDIPIGIYTFSMDCEGLGADEVWTFGIISQNSGKVISVKNGRSALTFEVTTAITAETKIILDDINRPTTSTRVVFSNFMWEAATSPSDFSYAPEEIESTYAKKITSTKYGIAYYSDAAGTFASTAAGTSGQYLKSNGTSAPTWATFSASTVGLGNVENTKLSTWAGSSNITTVGIISTGTWHGTKIANDYIANPKVTIAGHDVNLGGSLSAATLTSSLGLSNALHFIGITSTALTDGSTTATLIAKSTNSLSKTTGFVDGDVVIDGDQLREYVWSGSAWHLLGITTSTKYEKTTSGNTFISKITQATDGTITAESRELNTSGTWSGTATTATNLSAKPSLTASGNNITVTAGGKTSDVFTVPYATKASSANLTTTANTFAIFNNTTGAFADTNLQYWQNSANAGKTYIGWVKFASINLNDSNQWGDKIYDIFLDRTYNSPSSEVYNIRVSVGWTNSNIIQLSGRAGQQIITKFRIVRNHNTHKAYFEYYVNPSYTTYQNTVYIKILCYNGTAVTLINEVQTEDDSDFAYKEEINLANGMVSNGNFSGTFSGNANSATILKDTRTIWGQNFDGSANVTGNIIDVGPSMKLPENQTTFQFLTSGSGAANGQFGRLGLYSTYANADLATYVLDVGGKVRIKLPNTDTNSKEFIITGSNNKYISLHTSGIQAYDSSNNASLFYLQYNGGNLQIGSDSTASATRDFYGTFNFKSANGFTYSGMATGSDNAARPVWFSYNGIVGRPVYDNDFKYNPSTNTLTIGTGTLTATNYSGNAATATSATRVSSNNTISTKSGLQYAVGSITIGSADGNAKEGSNNSPTLWSYPTGGTVVNQNNTANIQNLRLYWEGENGKYFRDIFISPNNNTIYHRAVSNGTAGEWLKILDSSNYTDYAYALDGSNTGTKLQISTQSAAYTNGIQFMNSTTKKGSIGTDNSGIIGIYGTKIVLRPQLDASTKGVEVTTDAMYPTASMALGSTSARWSKLYIGSTNEYGDAYTPVYWNDGVPTAVTPIQYCEFTIGSGKKGVKLTHAAFTAASYVTQIVVTDGESNLNSTIAWESAAGYINLTCSATSGAVSGYILVSRGGAITATATDIT